MCETSNSLNNLWYQEMVANNKSWQFLVQKVNNHFDNVSLEFLIFDDASMMVQVTKKAC